MDFNVNKQEVISRVPTVFNTDNRTRFLFWIYRSKEANNNMSN